MKYVTKLILSIALTATLLLIVNTSVANASTNDDNSFEQTYTEAKSHLQTPYVLGSNGPSSFDCSSFTKYIYKQALNKDLPRTAQDQYDNQKHIAVKHLKQGDLVFFGANKRNITHVGMYIGNGKMIDAQNRGVVTENINVPWWNAVGGARVN